jgi:hypothetical protein
MTLVCNLIDFIYYRYICVVWDILLRTRENLCGHVVLLVYLVYLKKVLDLR